MRADKELVKVAVLTSGRVLGLASKELREDKEVVELAVSANAKALKFVPHDLKGDKVLSARYRPLLTLV